MVRLLIALSFKITKLRSYLLFSKTSHPKQLWDYLKQGLIYTVHPSPGVARQEPHFDTANVEHLTGREGVNCHVILASRTNQRGWFHASHESARTAGIGCRLSPYEALNTGHSTGRRLRRRPATCSARDNTKAVSSSFNDPNAARYPLPTPLSDDRINYHGSWKSALSPFQITGLHCQF